jgi:hypothetical protein
VREGRRRWLDSVPREWRSLAAGEGGGEVLQLEEGTREVRDHLAKEKGVRESKSPWWGGMAAAVADEEENGGGEGKGYAGGGDAHFKGVGGVEQRRGRGVGGGPARQSGGNSTRSAGVCPRVA